MNFLTIFTTFFTVRNNIIIISKILGLCFSIYYILNAKYYQVEWSIWKVYTWGSGFSNFLSAVGMYILIVPMTIIIASFMFPENRKLSLLASMFGVSSIIFTVIKMGFTTVPGVGLDFRFFKITPLMDLAEKQMLFMAEYKDYAKLKYSTPVELYQHLLTKLTPECFMTYNISLVKLQQTQEIKAYAEKVIMEYANEYLVAEHDKMKRSLYTLFMQQKAIIKIDSAIVILVSTCALIKLALGLSNLEMLNIFRSHVEVTQTNILTLKNVFDIIKTLTTDTALANKIQCVVKNIMVHMSIQVDTIDKRVTTLEAIVEKLLDQIDPSKNA